VQLRLLLVALRLVLCLLPELVRMHLPLMTIVWRLHTLTESRLILLLLRVVRVRRRMQPVLVAILLR
jgi:hypothetical protein